MTSCSGSAQGEDGWGIEIRELGITVHDGSIFGMGAGGVYVAGPGNTIRNLTVTTTGGFGIRTASSDTTTLVVENSVIQRNREVGIFAREGHDDGARDRRRIRQDAGDALAAVDRLAVVEIAVGAEQHLRRDLAEAVHHAADAEVGRTRRPDGAQAGRRQHGDRRLGRVGHEAGDPITRRHAVGAERGRGLRDPGVERGVAEFAPGAILAAEDHRRRVVTPAQQVLGVVEPRAGEPAGAGHSVAVDQHVVPAAARDHPTVLPERGPERLDVVDRPAPERRDVIEHDAALGREPAAEGRHIGRRHAFGRWRPEGAIHYRSSPQQDEWI